MGQSTSIQWAHHTFNPWRGCERVSPGCENCYAEKMSKRNPAVLGRWGGPKDGVRVVAADAYWSMPLSWERAAAREGVRARVFCASLADVFEDWPGEVTSVDGGLCLTALEGGRERPSRLRDVRELLFGLIDRTPHLDWLLLTKRPQNVARMVPRHWVQRVEGVGPGWPGNVWIGTSAEDEPRFHERVPVLRDLPAPIRFVSAEPLLGRIPGTVDLRGIDWVIVGGESGGGARPCDLAWTRELRRACGRAGVAFFHKQSGSHPYDGDAMGARAEALNREAESRSTCLSPAAQDVEHALLTEDLLVHGRVEVTDPKGGEPMDWPEDLRVREVPTC